MALHLICCVKQVPDPETPSASFRIDPVAKHAVPAPGIQPVGRTLPESQALVLNPGGALCGIGEAGEIVLRTRDGRAAATAPQPAPEPAHAPSQDHGGGHDR